MFEKLDYIEGELDERIRRLKEDVQGIDVKYIKKDILNLKEVASQLDVFSEAFLILSLHCSEAYKKGLAISKFFTGPSVRRHMETSRKDRPVVVSITKVDHRFVSEVMVGKIIFIARLL